MAYSAAKNAVFMERLKNAAVAFQNLREEGARLTDWWFQEIKVGGVNDEDFVDTDIATTAEAEMMMSFFADYKNFCENGVVASGWRNSHLVPFLADDDQV